MLDSRAHSARRTFMVLSPHALPYARLALRTLLSQSAQPLDLHLITDSSDDKRIIEDAVEDLHAGARHTWSVTAEEELADAEATLLGRLPHLRLFRHGHPCWRKITDPLLMSRGGDEMILLDPDLYFPNRFAFETTPESGILLMWQRPNCLLPSSVVREAMGAGVALARHVDIGVAHWRLSEGLDELEWLDWLIARLGGAALPRMMHVEAIVWSALAMRVGGGHLDPKLWVCWRRSQMKRLARKMGVSGRRILASEPWRKLKCFHAGGEAKWWLTDAEGSGRIERGASVLEPGNIVPFVELTARRFEREQAAKTMLADLGYYRVFDAGRS
ncbi:MAG: hypothetical protein V4555_09790 [Acidobacteriota bacterium]